MRALLAILAVVAQLQFRRVAAQIYTFEDVEVPLNRSLHTLYAFYIYSEIDAPEKVAGPPFVKFAGLAAKSTVPVASFDPELYMGLQVSIMKYRDFWTLINPERFCSDTEDVRAGRADAADMLMVSKAPSQKFSDVNVYPHTVKFRKQTVDEKRMVKDTGVYILVFSNCGTFSSATISGSVIVKNAYGFLPGIEYHKMPFYGWLFLAYVVLAIIWMGLSLRWWKEIFNIQICVAVVLFLGLVESFLWYIFFNDWNSTGTRGKVVFVLAIWFTVVKSCFSYMLVLVASLGWGVTRPFLDNSVIRKVQAVSFCYIVLDFTRETVLSFRHSHSLPLSFVFLCLLPVSLMNGGIFYWVFSALSNLITTLQERRQTQKLELFQRLWQILIVALAIATLTMLFQFFDVTREGTGRWRYQWLYVDGIPHILFLFVLVAMMYLWAPHKYSQRYAFSQQIGDDDDAPREMENPSAVWADDDVLDDGAGDDEGSFWAATQGGQSPDVIGKGP